MKTKVLSSVLLCNLAIAAAGAERPRAGDARASRQQGPWAAGARVPRRSRHARACTRGRQRDQAGAGPRRDRDRGYAGAHAVRARGRLQAAGRGRQGRLFARGRRPAGARSRHRRADGQALHLRRQGPQHQGDGLLAPEGDGRRGIPGLPVDPRGERAHGRPARAVLQDRRLPRREDGRARLSSPGRRLRARIATSRASIASATPAPTRSRTSSVTSSPRTATSPSTAPATCSSSRTPARTSSA